MDEEMLDKLQNIVQSLENMEKMRDEMKAKMQEKDSKKEMLIGFIDATLKIDPNNKPMRILKTKVNIDENSQLIMDSVHTNDDETNEKILKFLLELDSLVCQFIDYTGLEKK